MDWGFLQRLFNEDAWRQNQVAKLPPATMSDMRGPTMEDRFSKLQKHMEEDFNKEMQLRDLYSRIDKEGKEFGWPQPMPRNLWDIWISNQIKSQRPPGMI